VRHHAIEADDRKDQRNRAKESDECSHHALAAE
jgi:hypothetical protein